MQKSFGLTPGNQSLDPPAGQLRLSGNVVVSELIRNMELGRFEMAYAVLLPCVFTVYLNPADHAALSGVIELVVEDARRALRARVSQFNSPRTTFSLRKRAGLPKEHKIACAEWDIEFLPDSEVPAGDVEIHSELAAAPTPGLRGVKTTLLGREPAVTQHLIERRHSHSSNEPVYATIQYEDDSGKQNYPIARNRVRLGRGVDEQNLELLLYTTDEVSRDHATISRDPATGAFSILDASTNGTWVNGRRLRRGFAESLPARAEIVLGEVLHLLFEVRL